MSDDRAVRLLLRVIAAALLLLIMATWPLWTPGSPFPQIPWLAAAGWLPPAWDWLALAAIAAGAVLLFDPRGRGTVSGAALMSLGLMAALVVDQQRLQPWAYEYLLVTAILALQPRAAGLRCCRWLIISIYAWSALSKLDAAYLATNGRDLLFGLLQSFGLQPGGWRDGGLRSAPLLFPLGELAVAMTLAIPRFRRIGLVLSTVMHLLLLWVLGPFGLRHEPAVLIWNAAFIPQNWLLFRTAQVNTDGTADSDVSPTRAVAARVITLIAVVAPLLEWFGWWDHWPAWGVYASRPAQIVMLVEETAIDRLPPSLQSHVGPPEPLTTWRPVLLDRWTLAELNCPLNAQQRYRLAVAAALGDQYRLDDSLRVRLRSSPDRWTGQRVESELTGVDSVRAACDAYWINTRPRSIE
jgi:hypothetical protein